MLSLNLQFFGEDDLDMDSMLEEFEQEWVDEVEDDVEEPETVETTEPETTEEPEPAPIHDEDTQKRNAAFAEMRRQADEAKKYQEFVQKLAEQNGVTPDDVLARFEEQRLEEEAEKQQVPVDVLKRLNALETENSSVKEQAFAERFDNQVTATMEKYSATKEDVKKTFQYALDNGIDFRTSPISFEAAYKQAHLDTIIEKEVAKARQTDLENKRNRQQSATVPNGNSVTQVANEEVTDEEVDAYLEKHSIRL